MTKFIGNRIAKFFHTIQVQAIDYLTKKYIKPEANH